MLRKPSGTIIKLSIIAAAISGLPGCKPSKEELQKKKSAAQTASNIRYPTDNRLLPLDQITKKSQPTPPPAPVASETVKSNTITPKTPVITTNIDDIQLEAIESRWIDPAKLPSEKWEIQYVGETPVGYISQRVGPSLTRGASTLSSEMESVIRMTRGEERIEQRLKINTIEKASGELETIRVELSLGDETTITDGTVVKDMLRLRIERDGKVTQQNVAWRPEYRGPFAVEQSLLRSPLKPKEKRRLSYFDPILSQVVQVVLEAKDWTKSPVLDGSRRELIEARMLSFLGKNVIESVVWVDAEGLMQKSYIPLLDIRMFRADEQKVTAIRDAGQLDVMQLTSIVLEQKIERPSEAKSITYRVRSELGSQEFKSIPTSDFQTIAAKDLQSAQVVVLRPTWSNSSSVSETDKEYLQRSELIQSDDSRVIELAETLSKAGDPNSIEAVRLCQGVYQSIGKKSLAKGFLSAAQVARQLEGDCTEHAVLLAAVARARKIPARVVSGLVYSNSGEKPAMVYHMWNELWIDGKWVAADAVTGECPASPDRIAVRYSALNDLNPYSELLETMKITAKLRVQVEKVDY